jgi:two-component system phosphate regulon sensor histidine kinase PhoR
VTIIAAEGSVLGDSDLPSASMANHHDRPEVQQARVDGVGHSIRRSDSLGDDLLYVAVAFQTPDGAGGTVRVAKPFTETRAAINAIRGKVLGGVFVALLIMGLVYFIQTSRLKSLVDDVSEFSHAIAGGEFDRRLLVSGPGEFEGIAANLNRMAEELKATIQSDRERYEHLGAILKSIPDALLILNASDTVAMVNKTAEAFFGGAPLLGMPVRQVLRDSAFLDLIQKARAGRATGEAEIRHGHGRHSLVKVSPVDLEGGTRTGLVVLFHDITEARRVEQIRRDFVANVSHELKTPIASIKGFADTLADGAMDDRENAMRFIGIIQTNADRIAKLIDDLMIITRTEFGAIKMEKAPVALAALFRQVLADFEIRAGGKGLELKVKVEPGVTEILADRMRLVQVLTNLVDNALKYTDHGSVTLGARREGGRIVLLVTDTGIGIPREHLGRLGERFYRVDASRSRELGGTGLGLAIVKHLVQAHGWAMRIESEPGSGTTVSILT